jgi:hypothetical protein
MEARKMTVYGALIKVNSYECKQDFAEWAIDALKRKILRASISWLNKFDKADMDKLVKYMLKGDKSTNGLMASADRYIKRYCK